MPKVVCVPQEKKYRLLATAFLVGEARFIAASCSTKTDLVRPWTVTNWWNRGVGMPQRYEQRLVGHIHRVAARAVKVGDIKEVALAQYALHNLRRDYPEAFAPRNRYSYIRDIIMDYLREHGPSKAEDVIEFFGEQDINRQTLYNATADYGGIAKKNGIWSVNAT